MNAHRVEIFGQAYGLRSEAPEEHVQKVARLVDARMREVAAHTRSVATVQIAVLAALDLASDLLEEQENRRKLLETVESRCAEMIRRIDSRVPQASPDAEEEVVPLLCS
ncbi:hypothetical protein JCM30394_28260 [Deferrisoma palaeochoriense]